MRDLTATGITDGDAYLTNRVVPISRLIRDARPEDDVEDANDCTGGACFV